VVLAGECFWGTSDSKTAVLDLVAFVLALVTANQELKIVCLEKLLCHVLPEGHTYAPDI
jgi:hypothetical protein